VNEPHGNDKQRADELEQMAADAIGLNQQLPADQRRELFDLRRRLGRREEIDLPDED
jgi:hypothetical protein